MLLARCIFGLGPATWFVFRSYVVIEFGATAIRFSNNTALRRRTWRIRRGWPKMMLERHYGTAIVVA